MKPPLPVVVACDNRASEICEIGWRLRQVDLDLAGGNRSASVGGSDVRIISPRTPPADFWSICLLVSFRFRSSKRGSAKGCEPRNRDTSSGLASRIVTATTGNKMQIAPEITFEGSEPPPAAREAILKEIERLETHNRRITGCRVSVTAPSQKHRHGTGFQVHIWLTLPPHENIVVNQSHDDDARHEHVEVAIRDAFAIARRQVDALAI